MASYDPRGQVRLPPPDDGLPIAPGVIDEHADAVAERHLLHHREHHGAVPGGTGTSAHVQYKVATAKLKVIIHTSSLRLPRRLGFSSASPPLPADSIVRAVGNRR